MRCRVLGCSGGRARGGPRHRRPGHLHGHGDLADGEALVPHRENLPALVVGETVPIGPPSASTRSRAVTMSRSSTACVRVDLGAYVITRHDDLDPFFREADVLDVDDLVRRSEKLLAR